MAEEKDLEKRCTYKQVSEREMATRKGAYGYIDAGCYERGGYDKKCPYYATLGLIKERLRGKKESY